VTAFADAHFRVEKRVADGRTVTSVVPLDGEERVAEMARMLGAWKPAFIHSDAAKKLTRAIIAEAGLPDQQTHYDVPRPRTSFPIGHLTTGVAFAFPWHRDAWYSAPPQQLNWWMPVYPARPDNSMAFDLNYFAMSVPNDSETFDYYEINSRRLTTAAQVTKERQARPGAQGHQPASPKQPAVKSRVGHESSFGVVSDPRFALSSASARVPVRGSAMPGHGRSGPGSTTVETAPTWRSRATRRGDADASTSGAPPVQNSDGRFTPAPPRRPRADSRA
jgi:hypothetical protein